MESVTPGQLVGAEHEQLASHLTGAIRALRKHGFYVAQDPLGLAQPEAIQMGRAAEAACVLLNVASTEATRSAGVVQTLARELIENSNVAAARMPAMATPT